MLFVRMKKVGMMFVLCLVMSALPSCKGTRPSGDFCDLYQFTHFNKSPVEAVTGLADVTIDASLDNELAWERNCK